MADLNHTELHSEASLEQWLDSELHSETAPHTLASIACELAVSKRAVQNWHKLALSGEHGELGRLIGGERRFTASEREILLSYASERAKAPKPAQPSPAPTVQPVEPVAEVAAITVIEGNHRSTLAAPNFGSTINLGAQRGDLAVMSYGDPMAAAASALAVMGANAQAMAADLARQQNQLAQTAQAVAALKQQAEAMAQAQAEYRIKSDLLSVIQNQQTGELTTLLGKATALTGNGEQA